MSRKLLTVVSALASLVALPAAAQRVVPVPADEERLIVGGDSLVNIGGDANLRQALGAFVRGEALAAARGNRLMQGQFLMRQGGVKLRLGDSTAALERYRAGAAIFAEIQHSNLTYALRSIGRWYWRAGQLDSALAVYGRAEAFETARREPDRVMLQRLTSERDSITSLRGRRVRGGNGRP